MPAVDYRKTVNGLLRHLGYQLSRVGGDFSTVTDDSERDLVAAVQPFTMLSPARIMAFRDAVQYVERNNVPGAIVECGVWRGGAIMAAALTLKSGGSTEREIYLFDTFEGMTTPTEADQDAKGVKAADLLAQSERTSVIWAVASLEDVQQNVGGTGYPSELLHFVKGPVEETVPGQAPDEIAVLRLDTDWYESTRHELEHLVPRLSPNGVLIIDDYGHWKGSHQAVDEFLTATKTPILLSRTDYSGRMAVVPRC